MNAPRTVSQLLELIASGTSPKYVCFRGHQPSPNGAVSKSCFSQWWPSAFTVDGFVYPTAEHYMMAGKARLFGDAETLDRILNASHPKQAKELGRSVKNFDEATWTAQRFEIVVSGNHARFSQHPDLATFLMATGQRILVEASPVDRVWGIGLAPDSPQATAPERWRGLNLLGFALMEVRDRLLAQDPPKRQIPPP